MNLALKHDRMNSCSFSYYKIVVYLVQHNADISKPNKNGVTCLMNSLDSVPICRFLIDHGAELNAQDNESKTALHHAIEEHNFKITKLLLENGADSLLKNKHADDALQTACFCDNKSAFEYLIEKYSYSKERIAQAYELVGSTVLEESGNIIETLNHWRTALSLRNEDPNNYLVKKTIPQKASNPTVTEFNSEEELDIFALDMDAMKMQSLLVLERILGPFHRNTVSSLRNLWEFSCGANVKAVNCCLNTPLHLAAEARNYNPAIFNALLRHGAHADQKNKAGKTPFDVVKEADNFPLNPFRYTTLKCLAARKIMEKQVPFSGKVPAEIESFIKTH
ncbi:protein fem-1 homolog A-like [Uloborus diversus]|uniref:protein fem-1 homolog A-like n=1 Tax=Uloborus diversus TaxID=327109 RepID=UPI00240A46EC|nr:protein fem-1 homolog A-like [Uloborus diversus]